MNAFERRREARRTRQRNQRVSNSFVKLLGIDAIQKRYEDAWFLLHGTRITVNYRNGRYWVLGKSFLQSDILDRTTLLDAALHERSFSGELVD